VRCSPLPIGRCGNSIWTSESACERPARVAHRRGDAADGRLPGSVAPGHPVRHSDCHRCRGRRGGRGAASTRGPLGSSPRRGLTAPSVGGGGRRGTNRHADVDGAWQGASVRRHPRTAGSSSNKQGSTTPSTARWRWMTRSVECAATPATRRPSGAGGSDVTIGAFSDLAGPEQRAGGRCSSRRSSQPRPRRTAGGRVCSAARRQLGRHAHRPTS
jgi:hypothetical protein